MKHKTYIAALLAGMLALAGCGGGGNGVVEPPATVTAAQTAIKAATDAVAKLTAISDEDAVDAADDLIEDAEKAIEKAPESERVRLNAMLDAAEQEIQGQRTRLAALQEKDNEIEKLQGELDDEKERVTDLEGELEDEKDKVTELEEGLEKAEGRDAETMAKNLHAALAETNNANMEDFGAANEPPTNNNNQTYSFDGKKVTVDPEGLGNAPGSFDLAGTADAVSANSGWTGGHFKGKGDNKDHESRVYWLAETKGKGTKFSELGNSDIDNGDRAGNVIRFTGFNSGDETDRIVIDGFTGTSGQLTPPGARTTTNNDITTHTWPGSYYGVPGTYSCTGAPADCQVSRHADEKRKLVGMWTFTVTAANADMEVTAADNTYSYYGWWLNKASGGYQFDHFFGSSSTRGALIPAAGTSGTDDATGTATYTGGAAGKYAIYSTTPKAAESGDFTANVMLTADFDVPTMTTITGTIDKFMVDGSEKEGWEVGIEKNTNNSSSSTANIFKGIANWTIGENKGAGSWSAGFRDAGTDGVPKIVVGGFDVANDSAEMIGAFGASKQ